MAHEPLSRSLERLAAHPEIRTLNDILAQTDGRGIYLVIVLLCLPFVTPMPLVGLSNIVGVALVVIAIRLVRGLPSRLPRSLGSRVWPPERMQKIIRGSLRLLRWLERVVKPRKSLWLAQRWAVRLNGAVLGFMALLLALPIPPIIPLSNSLPAYAIILLSASMMEEDGATIWFAYAASVATLAYLIIFAGVIVRFFVTYEERIVGFLRNLL